jgi:hypothetical protein
MAHRDLELLEAIRRDDLSAVLSTRHEKPLDSLNLDDTPEMLCHWPYSIMVAAYFGSTKCFNYFFRTANLDCTDRVFSNFMTFPFPILDVPFFVIDT